VFSVLSEALQLKGCRHENKASAATKDGTFAFNTSWESKIWDSAAIQKQSTPGEDIETVKVQKISAHAPSGQVKIEVKWPGKTKLIKQTAIEETAVRSVSLNKFPLIY